MSLSAVPRESTIITAVGTRVVVGVTTTPCATKNKDKNQGGDKEEAMGVKRCDMKGPPSKWECKVCEAKWDWPEGCYSDGFGDPDSDIWTGHQSRQVDCTMDLDVSRILSKPLV